MNIENYEEVLKQVFDLSGTLQEALVSVNVMLEDGQIQDAVTVTDDIKAALESIDDSLEPVLEELQARNLSNITTELKEQVTKAKVDLAMDNSDKLKEDLKNEIFPKYIVWKEEVDKVLKPYVMQ
ncbi:hypothetical protein PRVXH_000502 [Proteinivorax hydrogeniformans]|uniref:DUF8042 domain-containing protein n=1 Tax=Proteinivorax hydrogeniformans TaxID=1826727 RepID=A0AAU8HUZ1_9FIRM